MTLSAVTASLGTDLGRRQLNVLLAGLRPGYGADLPDPADSFDGALFFKTGDKLYQLQSGTWEPVT